MSNDFKPFGDKMTKIQHKQVDKSYEIYLALYQSITGNEVQEDLFRQFSPDFFDLIIIDECHRGSAKENSAWRDVLTYFKWATQIGLTATPKETEDVSTQTYFWEPIYTYSLKQGIDDGFLAPYKVMRVGMSIDDGWRPFAGQTDIYGNEIEDRIYNNKDFDKTIDSQRENRLVAQKITQFLKNTDRFAKTIVFCVDIDHAERMRQALVNQNADLVAENSKYIMRITGDNPEWKMELDNFINPKEKYPTIVTTSKLMTTGVDAQTCKVIVLDTVINSMTEFKQIVGRGTRVNETYGKYYFTIIDFRQATNNFADPAFDGEPVVIYNPKEDEELDDSGEFWVEDENAIIEGIDTVIPEPDETAGQRKTYVDWVRVEIVNERVQYIWGDGKLITESMKDYTKKNILKQYTSLDNFLKDWNEAEKKEAIIEALEEKGIFFEELQKETGKELDPFDIICHIAFDRPPLTRKERANNVKKRDYFSKYGDQAREVLELLLQKYADSGIESIEDIGYWEWIPFPDLAHHSKFLLDSEEKKKIISKLSKS
jgi:type I restriction enzyme R subunit